MPERPEPVNHCHGGRTGSSPVEPVGTSRSPTATAPFGRTALVLAAHATSAARRSAAIVPREPVWRWARALERRRLFAAEGARGAGDVPRLARAAADVRRRSCAYAGVIGNAPGMAGAIIERVLAAAAADQRLSPT